jgi:hypothetical protein
MIGMARLPLALVLVPTLACADAASRGDELGETTGVDTSTSTSADATSSTDVSDSTASSTEESASSDTTSTDTTSTDTTSTDTDPPAPEQSLRLLTDQNRRYEGSMFGGWGPHLRAPMRAGDDTLWFCVDAGEDVLHNREIHYYHESPQGWSKVAMQPHAAGVQQNSACVMRNSTILAYSVNIATSVLEECYFDTADPQLDGQACNTITIGGPYATPPSSNYVGAILSPSGAKLVWFTVVGANGQPGQWIYTVDFGGGWNGPFVLALPQYNDFAYVHAAFVDEATVMMVGQGYLGAYPDGSFRAAVAEFTLGQVPTLVELQPGLGVMPSSSGDLWIDPASGDAHVLARADPAGVAYFYKPAGASWLDHASPVALLDDTFRTRFLAPSEGPLVLARGSAGTRGGVRLHLVDLATLAGPIDWASTSTLALELPDAGFDAPAAIFAESRAYQSAPVGGLAATLELATCGQYPERDVEIWHTRVAL